MVDDGTWLDYSRWPGPDREPTFAEAFEAVGALSESITVSLHKLIEDFARGVTYSARQNGKLAGLKPLSVTIDEMVKAGSLSVTEATSALRSVLEAYNKVEEKEKGTGRVHNHGPRPKSTFDRRGRRRY
jgi:hypothetical protein